MELAELQSVWHFVTADIVPKDLVDERTVEETMRRRSNAEISKIKRAMHLKFLMGSVAGVICTGAAVASVWFPEHFHPLDFLLPIGETTMFYLTLSIALLAMLWFNHRAYRKIQVVQNSAGDLKTSLERFIRVMEDAVRFNIYSDTFMSPVFITWFYYAYAYRDHHLGWDLWGLMLVILPLAVGIGSFYLQRFMQHLKFGRYLARLKSYLEALDPKKID